MSDQSPGKNPTTLPITAQEPLLEVRNLRTEFDTHGGVLHAVDDVSFSVNPGEVLGVVGESGSGKSVTALSIMGLIARPGRVAGDQIVLAGHGDLTTKTAAEMRKTRGDVISMIFQQPMTSLNPVFRIGWQIAEALQLHRNMTRTEATAQAVELLARVGIASPRQRVREFPHQLSGGMRQRVMIAMAMACAPQLLLADEPTTALDVSIQAQIINLLEELQKRLGLTFLFISHDLSVVRHIADRVAVMYLGQIVELADNARFYAHPMHPYSMALLSALPVPDPHVARNRIILKGDLPSPANLPQGCRFQSRCPYVTAKCGQASEPPLEEVAPGHQVRCWNLADIHAKS